MHRTGLLFLALALTPIFPATARAGGPDTTAIEERDEDTRDREDQDERERDGRRQTKSPAHAGLDRIDGDRHGRDARREEGHGEELVAADPRERSQREERHDRQPGGRQPAQDGPSERNRFSDLFHRGKILHPPLDGRCHRVRSGA